MELRGDIAIGRTRDGRDVVLAPMDDATACQMADVFASMDPWTSYGVQAQALQKYFAGCEPGAPRFIIRTGTDVAGVAGLRLNWLRGHYLQFLGLSPAFQGQGIGRIVLVWFERTGREAGGENVWVMVSQINERARVFYQQNEFVIAGEFQDLVVDGRAEFLMRKRLPH